MKYWKKILLYDLVLFVNTIVFNWHYVNAQSTSCLLLLCLKYMPVCNNNYFQTQLMYRKVSNLFRGTKTEKLNNTQLYKCSITPLTWQINNKVYCSFFADDYWLLRYLTQIKLNWSCEWYWIKNLIINYTIPNKKTVRVESLNHFPS